MPQLLDDENRTVGWYRTHRRGAISRLGADLGSEQLELLQGNLEVLVVKVVDTPKGRRAMLANGGWVTLKVLEPLPTRLNGVGMRRESGSWAEWLDALARTMSGRLREPSDGEKMLARLARDRIGELGVVRRRDGLCCEGTVADLQAALRYFEYLDDGERERISDLADAIWKSELEVDPVPLVSTCSSELQDNRSQTPLAPADSLAAALQSLASYLSVSFGTLTPSSFVSRQSSSDATSQLDARRKAARVALSGVDNLAWRKSQDRHVVEYLLRCIRTVMVRNCENVGGLALAAVLRRCGVLHNGEPISMLVASESLLSRVSKLRTRGRLMLRRWVHADVSHRTSRTRDPLQISRRYWRCARLGANAPIYSNDANDSEYDSENNDGNEKLDGLLPGCYSVPRPNWPARKEIRTVDEIVSHYNSTSRRRLTPENCYRSSARKLWCISDLHVDIGANLEWVRRLPVHREDALIVAGDVCASIPLFKKALALLKARYRDVFFVPGNHDLWVPPTDAVGALRCSVRKFFQLLFVCDQLEVISTPAELCDGTLILPLFSWYEPQFGKKMDEGFERTKDDTVQKTFDTLCSWPSFLKSLPSDEPDAEATTSSLSSNVDALFCALNAKHLELTKALSPTVIVSFSHFVPRASLFPGFKCFAPVMGSTTLQNQVHSLSPNVHVFGHSHIDVDDWIDGVRYVQNAVGQPADKDDLLEKAPVLIWDADWVDRDMATSDDRNLLASSRASGANDAPGN